MDGWMDGCMDRGIEGYVDGWMDGWMDGGMVGLRMYLESKHIKISPYLQMKENASTNMIGGRGELGGGVGVGGGKLGKKAEGGGRGKLRNTGEVLGMGDGGRKGEWKSEMDGGGRIKKRILDDQRMEGWII